MSSIPLRSSLGHRVRARATQLARRGALGLIAAGLSQPGTAQCTHEWRSEGLPGTDAEVYAMTHWDPDGAGPRQPVLAVGGRFLRAGTTYASGVVTYDKASGAWMPLDLGDVYALATLANGDLVAGHVAGVSRWTGTTWSPIGAAFQGTVVSLAAMANGDLIAGGSFTTAGGVTNIARWAGAGWLPLGSGISGTVNALAVMPNGDLVAGGTFTTAGGNSANRIARWDGTTWSPLGSGVSGSSNTVHALEVLPNGDLIVGGLFTTAGGVPANSIARWDGSTWSPLGLGMTNAAIGGSASRVRSLETLANGDLVAAGDFPFAGGVSAVGVARWDGATWSPLGSGVNNSFPSWRPLSLLTLTNGDLMMGGEFVEVGGVVAYRLARWNGTAWSTVGTGMDRAVIALATMPNGELVAGGSFRTAGGGAATGIARSDIHGTEWSPLGTGVGGSVLAITLAANGDLFAGGDFVTAGGTPAARIARWDGAAWSPLGTGVTGTVIPRVYALTTTQNGDVIAGGSFSTAGGLGAPGVARWNGNAWSPLGSGTNGAVYALATLPNGDVMAGGDFTTAGGVAAARIARWNGSTWSPLGAGTNGVVWCLLPLPSGDVLAGGTFGIARWNGSSWSPFGTGLSGTVYALTTLPNSDVVAGGDFLVPGGSFLAQWDGVAWSSPGGGTDNVVTALATMPSGTFAVGGNFRNVNSHWLLVPFPYIAFRTTSCPATATPNGNGCVGSAGPVQTTASLPWVGSVSHCRTTGFAANALGCALLGFTSPGSSLGLLHPTAGAGCALHASPDVALLRMPTAGAVTFDLAIPNSMALVGVVLFHQVLQGELDPVGQLVSLTSSNGLRLEIGAF